MHPTPPSSPPEQLAHSVGYRVSAYGSVTRPDGSVQTTRPDKDGNPEHLFLGTDQDNADDRRNKGRQGLSGIAGRRNWCKLKPEEVVDIKRLCAAGATDRQVADHYRITASNVYAIRTGRSWKAVKTLKPEAHKEREE